MHDFIPGQPVPNLTLLRRLLDRGEDPNKLYGGDTAWKEVLLVAQVISEDVSIPFKMRISLLNHWADIAEVFIVLYMMLTHLPIKNLNWAHKSGERLAHSCQRGPGN